MTSRCPWRGRWSAVEATGLRLEDKQIDELRESLECVVGEFAGDGASFVGQVDLVHVRGASDAELRSDD